MAEQAYDKRQQLFGNEAGMFAIYDRDTKTYGELQWLTGMNTFTFSEPDAPDPIRRDNRVHVTLPSDESATLQLMISQLPASFLTGVLGHVKSANGLWTRGHKKSPFYFAYIQKVIDEDGVQSRQLNIFYNATFTKMEDLDTETDSEFDLGVNANVDNAPWVTVDGTEQAYTYVRDTDGAESKALIDYALAGNVILPTTAPQSN